MVTRNQKTEDRSQKRISILGATGSIGRQTLDVIRQHPDKFKVTAITGGKNVAALAAAVREFQPEVVAIADETEFRNLKSEIGSLKTKILCGDQGVIEAAQYNADITMAAIVGIAGLAPTLAALEQGRRVALANKEALVCAGPLMLAAAAQSGATILPVDSEHNAIFQVFENHNRDNVRKIILTASGGPFRTWDAAAIQNATRAEALNHPNWVMGEKILIDSATMVNKGLELIEAHYLFNMPPPQIEILVHPQSIIHSMVAYRDGSVLAQLGPPDMQVPIAYCLGYPHRIATRVAALDFSAIQSLTFEPPDGVKFHALGLAQAALNAGGTMPTILNAANEVAVAAFLTEKISFGHITQIIDAVMQGVENGPVETMAEVWAADAAARRKAQELIKWKP